jgi:hypothetical protein
MNIDYWMAVPLIGIAATIPFWIWLYVTRPRDRQPPHRPR